MDAPYYIILYILINLGEREIKDGFVHEREKRVKLERPNPRVHIHTTMAFTSLLWLSYPFNVSFKLSYKAQMERTNISLNVLLFFLPVMLIQLAHVTMRRPSKVRIPRLVEYELISREESSPWGVAMVVVVVLVMVYYQSSIQSGWFRPL